MSKVEKALIAGATLAKMQAGGEGSGRHSSGLDPDALHKLQMGRVEEFKGRLRSTISKQANDHFTRQQMDDYRTKHADNPKALSDMLEVYHLKYQQLLDAIKEQK
jgi:hypothetical protein